MEELDVRRCITVKTYDGDRISDAAQRQFNRQAALVMHIILTSIVPTYLLVGSTKPMMNQMQFLLLKARQHK